MTWTNAIAAAPLIVRVKFCEAAVPMPLFAVIVIGKLPVEVAVPLSVAVPLPLSTNVTPVGSEPVSFSAGVGEPEVVTVKDPATPAVKDVPDALVTEGD